MSSQVRDFISKYKVHAVVVAGAVVAATVWGNYTFETNSQSASVVEEVTAETTAVSNTASVTGEATEATGTITGTVETAGTNETNTAATAE